MTALTHTVGRGPRWTRCMGDSTESQRRMRTILRRLESCKCLSRGIGPRQGAVWPSQTISSWPFGSGFIRRLPDYARTNFEIPTTFCDTSSSYFPDVHICLSQTCLRFHPAWLATPAQSKTQPCHNYATQMATPRSSCEGQEDDKEVEVRFDSVQTYAPHTNADD